MIEWKQDSLKNICTLLNRGVSPKYVESGVLILNQKCIRDNRVNFDECKYSSTEKKVAKEKYIQELDVLVNSTGTGTLGRTAQIKRIDQETLVDTHITIVRPNNNIVDPTFIAYQLSSKEPEIVSLGKGATNQQELGRDELGGILMTLPPLPIQKRIAEILSAYDDLIENNLKRIKLLEELAQRTYEEWFVRFRVNGEQLPIDKSTGLPVGWEKKKLVDVAILTMGQSPKSEYYNNERRGLPFHQGVSDYGFRFPENSSWSTEGNRFAEKGDILFSVRAPVGRLNVAIEKIILGRGLAAIRERNGLTNLLFYQLQNIFFKDDIIGGGAIFNSVTKSDMERILVTVPKSSIGAKFNSFVQNIDKQIETLTLQNTKLKESRDILLPRLMNGTITVTP